LACEAIVAKYILLGFTPNLFGQIRAHAKEQNLSVVELIHRAVRYYLSSSRLEKIGTSTDDMPESGSKFFWTQAEKEYARRVLQRHFDEDR
jgi:hypothetical protein